MTVYRATNSNSTCLELNACILRKSRKLSLKDVFTYLCLWKYQFLAPSSYILHTQEYTSACLVNLRCTDDSLDTFKIYPDRSSQYPSYVALILKPG